MANIPKAVPMTEIDIADDEALRFIQRVLESSAPQEDRDRAAQMVREIRTRVRKVYAARATPAEGAQSQDAHDARRYRWLRDLSTPTFDPVDNGLPWCARCDASAIGNELLYGAALDEAVDAALERSDAGGKE
jgi:hypothetical protein